MLQCVAVLLSHLSTDLHRCAASWRLLSAVQLRPGLMQQSWPETWRLAREFQQLDLLLCALLLSRLWAVAAVCLTLWSPSTSHVSVAIFTTHT